MTAPVVAVLDRLTPAADEAWHLLFDLAEKDAKNWVLVGGQMVYLPAVENGVEPARATDDVDVVVNVRARPGATEWLAAWLVEAGFEMAVPSADGLGHRFTRGASPGPGTVAIDILAPDGIGARASLFTRRPARTVQAPGSTQALDRSELVTVTIAGDTGRDPRTGQVQRPTVLGALIAKAAATTLAVREHPERDWQDAALLLAIIPDPIAAAEECSKKDRQRLRDLEPLTNVRHPVWLLLDPGQRRSGRDALGFLLS